MTDIEGPPLPKIDDVLPDSCKYTISGVISDQAAQPDRVFRMQEQVTFVATGRVVGVNHGEKVVDGDAVVVRAVAVKVDSLYEFDPETAAGS